MALTRLQKILADRGVASRRKAEELIEHGHVRVNGHPAKIGDKADDRRDIITVRGKRIDAPPELMYLMLHKPRGYITTLSDENGRKCVADLVRDVGARVYPIGRLDKDSEGLLLFTNDGAFSNAMMHPTAHVPKRYRVTVRSEVTEEQLSRFEQGILIDGKKTLPAEAVIVTEEKETPDSPARTVLEIVLYEGRNRQIRKMCEALGLEVVRLKRTAIGTVKLGMLPLGKWRLLDPKEVRALLMAAQVNEKIAAKYIKNGKGQGNYGRSTSRR